NRSALGWTVGIAGGAMTLARALNRRRRRIDLGGRVAIITGGSRGLGLELARQLADQGAELALVARTAGDLERAHAELLAERGCDALAIAADVGRPGAMDKVVEEVLAHHGRVDILINCAGVMLVAPLDHLEPDDYARAMAAHFWGPLHAMNAVIPVMRRQGGGRIVNISSIGGRVAVPHMLPYSASKFALTGLSDGLGAELAREGIRVTTVWPWLMRTGSHLNIDLKGRHREELTWFSLAASLPVLTMSPRRAAARIRGAGRHGDRHLTLGMLARLAIAASAIAPELVADLMAAGNRLLPAPAGSPAGDLERSARASSDRLPRALTRLGERAALRHNQLRGGSPAAPSLHR